MLLLILPALAMVSPLPSASKTFRRAEFWDSDSATLLEVVNVIGRWERADEWSARSEFTEIADDARGESTIAQSGTLKRYEMAQRTGTVERIAMVQNIAALPFRSEPLAAAVGLSIEEMNGQPISRAAVNVVYDALSQSRASLLPPDVIESRRRGWLSADGALDEGAFAASLFKARVAVIASWFVFGKGNLIGLLVVLKVLSDNFADGAAAYTYLLDHQEAALLAVATAGLMSAVGQEQGVAPPEEAGTK